MTHVVVVHNNVDESSSIGKLAAWSVRTALQAGWRVTVVARDLDAGLRGDVGWRRLYVPPRMHAFQWSVARPTVRVALRGVKPDILHVYQPQLASMADTWHVAYLSRVAVETASLHSGAGPRDRVVRAQQRAVALMEDAYLRAISERPTVLFCSEQVEAHFVRLYGAPDRSAVLYNPSFKVASAASRSSRHEARSAFGVSPTAWVVGFLGGLDERKGWRELVQAVAERQDGTVLLLAGPRSENFTDPRLGVRLRALGMVDDLSAFWAACDVLAVPSRFDPFAMVVTEAAAHGVPVVVTETVGAAELVRRHRAGLVCHPDELAGALRGLRGSDCSGGLQALTREVAADVLSGQLLDHWQSILSRG